MQEEHKRHVLSIIGINLIRVGRRELRASARAFQRTSTVTRMMTRTSTIPVTVCSDERPGVAAVGIGGGGGY